MAKTSLSNIKNWFKTGLKPTQQHFWDTWDSFWHKDENIPNNKVEGLADLLNGKADAEAFENYKNSQDDNKLPVDATDAQVLLFDEVQSKWLPNDKIKINAGLDIEFQRAAAAGGGVIGLRLNKKSASDLRPHGFIFALEGENKWDFGMDFELPEIILAYNHRDGYQGDAIRGADNGKWNFGTGIGSPAANAAKFTFKVSPVIDENLIVIAIETLQPTDIGLQTSGVLKTTYKLLGGNAVLKAYHNNPDFAQFVNDALIDDVQKYGIMQNSSGAMFYGGASHLFEYGNVNIATKLNLSALPIYADNTAASSLSNGEVYRTNTGELRIKI